MLWLSSNVLAERPEPFPFPSGTVLYSEGEDTYTLLDPIAQGFFGWVYQAEMGTSKKLVAIKIFKNKNGSNNNREEAYNLIQNMKGPTPDLLKVYYSGKLSVKTNQGEQIISAVVQELAKDSLEHKSKALFKDKIDWAIKMTAHVIRAITSLEANQLVHRDIRPRNVLERFDGSLALGDFDLVGPEGLSEYQKKQNALASFGLFTPMPVQAVTNPMERWTSLKDLNDLGRAIIELLFGNNLRELSYDEQFDFALNLFKRNRGIVSERYLEKYDLLEIYVLSFLSVKPEERIAGVFQSKNLNDLLIPLRRYVEIEPLLTCQDLFGIL